MDNLKTMEVFYDAFEYFLEVVVVLKKEGNLRSGSLEQQKIKEFFETYCDDCLDGSEIVEAIDDFKVAERYGDSGRKKMIIFIKQLVFFIRV